MKGDPVPDVHHIARYCGGATLNEDGTPNGAAFRLRLRSGKPEQFLSVNWLEHLALGSREAELIELRKVLNGKGLQLGATARIAILNVGELRQHVAANSPDGRALQVLHEPEQADPSHSGIHGLSLDDDLIAESIGGGRLRALSRSYPLAWRVSLPALCQPLGVPRCDSCSSCDSRTHC